eukprot:2527857-Amphidinium_carterae.1
MQGSSLSQSESCLAATPHFDFNQLFTATQIQALFGRTKLTIPRGANMTQLALSAATSSSNSLILSCTSQPQAYTQQLVFECSLAARPVWLKIESKSFDFHTCDMTKSQLTSNSETRLSDLSNMHQRMAQFEITLKIGARHARPDGSATITDKIQAAFSE